MDRLSLQEKQALRGIRDGRLQLIDDPVRDELARRGLVEMKLGGWGITDKGRTAALFGRV